MRDNLSGPHLHTYSNFVNLAIASNKKAICLNGQRVLKIISFLKDNDISDIIMIV